MKTSLIMCLLFSLHTQASDPSPKDPSIRTEKSFSLEPTIVSSYSQEIEFSKDLLARNLFLEINTKPVEANLVAGLFFKYGEYIFCLKEPGGSFKCSVYFSSYGDGSLSSYYEDTDFGKGDTVDAIITKKRDHEAYAYYKDGDLFLYFEGSFAANAYKKYLALAYDEYIENKTGKYLTRIGKHLSCQKRGEKFNCMLKIPVRPTDKDLENVI